MCKWDCLNADLSASIHIHLYQQKDSRRDQLNERYWFNTIKHISFHINSFCISYHVKIKLLKEYIQSFILYVYVVFITRFTFSLNPLLMIATDITDNWTLTNYKNISCKKTFREWHFTRTCSIGYAASTLGQFMDCNNNMDFLIWYSFTENVVYHFV